MLSTMVLRKELFSAMAEEEPNEAVRNLPRTLVSDPAKPSESVSDLKNELLSEKPEAEPIAPVKDLAKPFVPTVTRDSEPVRDLDIER